VRFPPLRHPLVGEWLLSVGPVMSGPMGAVAVTWLEVGSWSALTGVALSAWEAEAIVIASREYAAAMETYSNKQHDQPWQPESEKTDMSKKLRAMFAPAR